ncbi:MAG TPA: hypothetical protein VGM30_23000 [Puia sp.]
MSNTDFVNSGSYLRTVFVFISGITTLTGFAGTTGFLFSVFSIGFDAGFADTIGGGVAMALPAPGVTGVCLTTGAIGAVADCFSEDAFVAAGCAFAAPAAADEAFEAGPAADLEILEVTTGFFTGTGTGFFERGMGATFLATGLAILLDAGAFLAALLPPDDWAGFAAAFFAGTIFLTLVGFLAGFAAFFLVAIQLGFFSNKHF